MKLSILATTGVLFIFLTRTASVCGQESNHRPLDNSSSTEGPALQESETPIPEIESEGFESENIPPIAGDIEDSGNTIEIGGVGRKVGEPKQMLYDNLYSYYYNYDYNDYYRYNYYNGYYRGYGYRRYPYGYTGYYGYGRGRWCCRLYRRQCFNSPYYWCRTVCDNWGYYYY